MPFISALTLVMSFLLLTLDLACSSFCNSLSCKVDIFLFEKQVYFLLLDGMFCICLLSPFGLKYRPSNKVYFLTDSLSGQSILC